MNSDEDDFEGMASTEELETATLYGDELPEPEEEQPEEGQVAKEEIAEEPRAVPVAPSSSTAAIGTPIFLPNLSAAEARTRRTTGRVASSTLARIGEGIRSPVNEYDDELNELFEGISEYDSDVYFDDLVRVDDEDIFGDGGEDMSDLLEVDPEDFMGEFDEEPTPSRKHRSLPVRTKTAPPGIRGMEVG